MWTNSSGVASAAVVGAFLFSTHAAGSELPSEELLGSDTYVVNFVGEYWSTANTNVDGGPVPSERQDVAALGIGDVIQKAKVSLGLPNKDIARIFGVTRQTLYSYSKGLDSERTANTQTRQRVFQLTPVLERLEAIFSKSPGAMAKNYVVDGVTLFDLLARDELEFDSICQVAHVLNEKLEKIAHSSARPSVSGDETLHELSKHA
jgi:DNA-binding XRE family transcriptional regulator